MGRALQVLTVADVVEINRRMIDAFGGFFVGADNNLANPGSLDHVLQEIQGSLFGHEPYPTVIEKAAAIGWRIIAGHVFHDGNKRTGMEACRQFLELNGYRMRIDRGVVCMALEIARNEVNSSKFADWLGERTSKVTLSG